jgi:hypothetical protein
MGAYGASFLNARKRRPDRNMEMGSVSTQAIARFLIVFHWIPDRFAAIVPATPDDRTWVVLTGSPR